MAYEPDDALRLALTALDTGEVDVIVTVPSEAVDWARANSYTVIDAEQDGEPICEIRPGAARHPTS